MKAQGISFAIGLAAGCFGGLIGLGGGIIRPPCWWNCSIWISAARTARPWWF